MMSSSPLWRSTRLVVLVGPLFLSISLLPPSAAAQDLADASVLVFSKTNGYRHAAIPDGVRALRALANEHGFEATATEDSTAMRPSRLSAVDVVVFLNTSGDVLGPAGQDALCRFIRDGGGYVGVHAASDTEYDWAWYGRLVGAYFDGHPEIQEAVVRVERPSHPSTRMLPEAWTRRDEWYNFDSNPRDSVQVLLTLDEGTYDGGTMGDDHPIAWKHEFDEGRAWYTAGGHTKASYRAPCFGSTCSEGFGGPLAHRRRPTGRAVAGRSACSARTTLDCTFRVPRCTLDVLD